MGTKVNDALELLNQRMNDKIENLKESMRIEVIEIKKYLEESSNQASKVCGVTLNNWIERELKGEFRFDETVQTQQELQQPLEHNYNFDLNQLSTPNNVVETLQDVTRDKKPSISNGDILPATTLEKLGAMSNIVLEMSEKPSIVGKIKASEFILDANSTNTNGSNEDPNRILAQFRSIPYNTDFENSVFRDTSDNTNKHTVDTDYSEHSTPTYDPAEYKMYDACKEQYFVFPGQAIVKKDPDVDMEPKSIESHETYADTTSAPAFINEPPSITDNVENSVHNNPQFNDTEPTSIRTNQSTECLRASKKGLTKVGKNVNKKEFHCDKCPYTSTYKENVVKHTKIIHNKIKDLECSHCPFKTNVKTNLTHHIKAVHMKVREFLCTQCEYSFTQKRNLINHINRQHVNTPKRPLPVQTVGDWTNDPIEALKNELEEGFLNEVNEPLKPEPRNTYPSQDMVQLNQESMSIGPQSIDNNYIMEEERTLEDATWEKAQVQDQKYIIEHEKTFDDISPTWDKKLPLTDDEIFSSASLDMPTNMTDIVLEMFDNPSVIDTSTRADIFGVTFD